MNLKEWLVGSFAQIGQILSILYGLFTTFLCGGDASVCFTNTPLSRRTGVSLLGDSLVRFISQKNTYGESGGNGFPGGVAKLVKARNCYFRDQRFESSHRRVSLWGHFVSPHPSLIERLKPHSFVEIFFHWKASFTFPMERRYMLLLHGRGVCL